MLGKNGTLNIPSSIMEGIMNKLGISVVTKTDGWTIDIYNDTAGNSIEDNLSSWLQKPDKAICRNGAQPTDAQIQEAIRRSRSGEVHDVSGNRTKYLFPTETSPLESMCELAAKPARTARPR